MAVSMFIVRLIIGLLVKQLHTLNFVAATCTYPQRCVSCPKGLPHGIYSCCFVIGLLRACFTMAAYGR
jgi:hypothetical protein